ncbi:hypothetical protein A3J34_02310 [Candidatus Peribacteria bacterium RIFCSPLOWO2_02_FULL_51_10]|nr:MAG: hypothetical protein A3J34_02310 [Candidatus Peribacteria bacterium RIFCSPLOWO2_02_FULL_51_10]
MPIAKERILFEDQWLIAVTKLSGELVVRGKGKLQRLPLLDFLRKSYPSLVPVHRLDFETSGVVVFAKTKQTLQKILKDKFSGWRKTYLALVLGCPSKASGSVDFRLPARNSDSKVEAKTEFRILEKLNGCALVELSFERGQRHQIRRHMAMIGHPLILDEVYGDKKANKLFSRKLKLHRFLLHASAIIFPHPETGNGIQIVSPVPPVFSQALKKCRM